MLAYGVGLWLVVLHQAEGGRERVEPALLAHWLRDATLALPGVLVAVWATVWLARHLLAATGASSRLERALVAAAAATGACVVLAAASPVHDWLFAAHGGHGLPLVAHLARDVLLALAAGLPLAVAVVALTLGGRAGPSPRRRARHLALVGLAAALAAVSGGAAEGAGLGPGNPCPATAPLRHFAVQAIDVDMTLNRYGDHDPAGKMFVLASRVADVRAQEASRSVSTGLRADAIQPLVIRANQGECVEIAFTNNASGGEFGIHIDGLAFDVGSSGDAVGANPPTSSAARSRPSRSRSGRTPVTATPSR